MANEFFLRLTKAGRDALINASGNGTAKTQLISMGVSTAPFAFDENMTELPSEYKRITTIGGIALDRSLISVSVKDTSTDVYKMYGFGFYLEDEAQNIILMGVYSQDALISEHSESANLLLQLDIAIEDAQIDATQITFGDLLFFNPPATTTQEGVARIATDDEAMAGELNTHVFITPKQLKYGLENGVPEATEALKGIGRIATLEEVLAGELAENIFITPATLEQVLRLRAYPLGAYVYAPFSEPPPGCVRANGTLLPLPIYQDFFDKVGTRYGGDGSTTVGTLDLRGLFPRFNDDGRGVDPGRVLGTFQESSAISEYIGESVTGDGFKTYIDNPDSLARTQTGFVRHSGTQSFASWSPFQRIRPRNFSIAAFIFAYYPRSI